MPLGGAHLAAIDPQLLGHLPGGQRIVAAEPGTQLEHLALAAGQRAEASAQPLDLGPETLLPRPASLGRRAAALPRAAGRR
jgi:hypothetical protein